MLRISAITLFPRLFDAITDEGVIARAIENELVRFDTVDLRQFSQTDRRNVDAPPTGGGDGMVLLPDVCQNALNSVRTAKSWVVVLSPSGKVFSHEKAKEWAKKEHLILVCGRYAGFDKRFEDRCANEMISLGDFVVSGGELPAMCIIDAVARQVPGVLGNTQSAQQDSHSQVLLEHSQYTKPHVWEGVEAPSALLKGDHGEIKKLRRYDALRTTALMRPDLLDLVWDELTRSEKAFVTKVLKMG